MTPRPETGALRRNASPRPEQPVPEPARVRASSKGTAALRRNARVFGRLLGLHVSMTFVYRGDFFLLQISNVMIPVVSLLVWRAAIAAGADVGVDGAYLDTYFVLVSLVAMATSSWSAQFLAAGIRNGELSRFLVRPTSQHLDLIANNLGEKIVKTVLLVPILIIVVLLLPGRLRMPGDPLHWLLGAVAVIIAAGIWICFDIARGALAFWFEDVQGFNTALDLISYVLSGSIVPLALMPAAFASVLSWQPFRFMVSFPIEVALGQVQGGIAFGFAQQVGWLAVLAAVAATVWKLGLRQYSAAGA